MRLLFKYSNGSRVIYQLSSLSSKPHDRDLDQLAPKGTVEAAQFIYYLLALLLCSTGTRTFVFATELKGYH
jgi:hypothetical protein